MQVRLLTANEPLELGYARLGRSKFVRAPCGRRAGVRGRRPVCRRERGRRRSPSHFPPPLAIEPGRAVHPIGLAPLIDQLWRNPALPRKRRHPLAALQPRQKTHFEIGGKQTRRCFRHGLSPRKPRHPFSRVSLSGSTPRKQGNCRPGREEVPLADSIEAHNAEGAVSHSGPAPALFASPTAAGRVNWKTAPFGRFGDAQSRPPCASMIERQIDNPIPMPCGLVVKNAPKSLSVCARPNPRPEASAA